MTEPVPLPFRPTPWEWEPAHSFATRWAVQAGHASVGAFCLSLGISAASLLDGRSNGRLAELAGLPADAFDRSTVRRSPTGPLSFGGIEISRKDWMPTEVRVCPPCLAEDAGRARRRGERPEHLRFWWALRCVAQCPVHLASLVTLPSNPLDPLLFDELERASAIPAGRNEIVDGPGRYVLGRLGVIAPTPVPALDSLSPSLAVRVMDVVGLSTDAADEPDRARRRGLELLADDAAGLMRHLDGLSDRARGDRAVWGATDVYGRLYTWTNRRRGEPGMDELIGIIRRHALAHVPLSPEVPLFGTPIERRRLHTVHHIGKRCGLHPQKVEQLLDLAGETGTMTCGLRCFRDADVAGLVDLLTDILSYNAARSHLGLSRAAMAGLFDAGVLAPKFRAGQGISEHAFLRRALDGLVERMADGAPSVARSPKGVGDLVAAGRATRTSCAEVAQLVLSGRVRCCGRMDRRGLSSLGFRFSDVRAALKVHRDEFVTHVDAASRLGTTFYICRALADAGYLGSPSADPRDRRACHFEPAAIAAFLADYEGAFDVAMRFGTHARVLLPKLARHGIVPAIAKEKVGKAYFHRRQLPEIEAALSVVGSGAVIPRAAAACGRA